MPLPHASPHPCFFFLLAPTRPIEAAGGTFQLIVGAQMLGMAIADTSFLLVRAHRCFTALFAMCARPPRRHQCAAAAGGTCGVEASLWSEGCLPACLPACLPVSLAHVRLTHCMPPPHSFLPLIQCSSRSSRAPSCSPTSTHTPSLRSRSQASCAAADAAHASIASAAAAAAASSAPPAATARHRSAPAAHLPQRRQCSSPGDH